MPGVGMGGTSRRMLRGIQAAEEVAGHKLSPQLIKRILIFARPLRRLIIGFIITIVIGAVLAVLPPLLFKQIIDQGVLAQDKQVVITLACVVAGLAIGEAANALLQRWWSARIGEGLIFDLRTRVFDHVLSMPVAFFTRAQTGKLVSRLNTDVIGAQQAFTSTLSSVLSNVISVVLVLAAMVYLSWQLTLAALLVLPLFIIPARIVGVALARLTRQQMQLNGELSEVMTERFSVSGALLVKLFGRSDDEHDRFAERAGAVRDTSVSIALQGRFLWAALTLMSALATALVYGVGGLMSIDGALTVGTLTALAGLLVRLYGPLTGLTNLHVDVMSALISFERVFEVLDTPPMITSAPGAPPVSGEASVRFEQVDFAYPGSKDVSLASLEHVAVTKTRESSPVLHDISFAVAPGETVALVGPSGAGKTTISHLIARLYDVTSGSIEVGGKNVRDLDLASLQTTIGYVTQDAHMFHDTIRNNLAYAKPDATSDEMMAALHAAQIAAMVEALPDGLDTVVGDRGYRLSGGERQRLAIARVLLKAPPIVVLDEATAHLDSESEAAVQRALDITMTGRTNIVIAHRLSTVRQADLILVVSQGRIVQRGTHDELLAAGGLYADLHATQWGEAEN